jgi:hypothetical protein
MRPPIEFLFPPEIGAGLIYSIVIITCSLMIYYSTKEMYELSSYKGLKYFRRAFLFFAIAYFFRYFIQFFLIFFDVKNFDSFRFIFSSSMFVFMFFSSMAIFYLLYSIMWKKWNHSSLNLILFNFLALAIAIITTSFREIKIIIGLNLLLLFSIWIILFIAYREPKNKRGTEGLLVIYLLLSAFLVLNVIDILIPKFLQMYQLIIYSASIIIFMIILYKVLKKAGS